MEIKKFCLLLLVIFRPDHSANVSQLLPVQPSSRR